MKKITDTDPKQVAKELVTEAVDRRRKALKLKPTDTNKTIIAQLSTNQYQLYRKIVRSGGNATLGKVIELVQAIDPTATILINIV